MTASAPAPQPDLIFDLGMHRGDDARFYLDKGFRVMALEASPTMCAHVRLTQAEAIAAGRLVIEEAALWHRGGEEISFWLNPVKDDWSSALRDWATKGNHAVQEVRVRTVTLTELFDRHGVPRYLKCDVEGMDEPFTEQLLRDGRRPAFVSIEAVSLDALAILRACGYDRVQIVNQAFNAYLQPPDPPREGRHAPARFHGHMSGLFGRELDPAGWRSFRDAAEAFLDFCRLQARQETLAHGWIDFHVTTSATLERA
jgi:FkbM family methyltransferase